MTKSLKNLWGRFLFQDRGILPTKRLLFIGQIFSVGLILGTAFGISWSMIIVSNIFLLLASLIDLTLSAKKRQLTFKRMIPAEMERGITYTVQLELVNASSYPVKFRLLDGIPQSFKKSFPIHGTLSKESKTVIGYETTATVRGDYEIEKLYFRYTSLLGLWEKQITVMLKDSIKVIPDLTETKQYLANAQQFLQYEGVKIRRHQSGVGEFAKIRNFVVGDDPRKINWRQTAKLQEVMTNEYEPEHGKYITILIDCGRMMGAELTKGNRLERTLEASLMLAAAALQRGDYVAVLAFSKNVKVYIPPAKGMAHLQTILHAIYNVKVDATESNYASVLTFLQTVLRKRTMLLLFSDVRTLLYEESALWHLQRRRQRHLFMLIGIEDKTLITRAGDEPTDVQRAMVKSMAQGQMLFKKREKMKWEKSGLRMMEAREEKLATAAVSYYIESLNRGIL